MNRPLPAVDAHFSQSLPKNPLTSHSEYNLDMIVFHYYLSSRISISVYLHITKSVSELPSISLVSRSTKFLISPLFIQSPLYKSSLSQRLKEPKVSRYRLTFHRTTYLIQSCAHFLVFISPTLHI